MALDLAAGDWATLSTLLDVVLDVSAEERERWLDSLPPEHRRFRPSIEEFLSAHAGAEHAGFLDALPPLESTAAEPDPSGREIGPYRVERELGRGGMGTVWLAYRSDGTLKRPVALKLPRTGPLDRQLGERLARERDILASLTHPHIARLYDAGVTGDGQPYLALEYVEGEPITSYCDGKRLRIRDRIELFLQVLDAVQYAHASLVVHRDLKPGNVLVDREGKVKLLDFGIAKLLEVEGGEARETQLTEVAGRALTLDFASPEQIQGLPITTASDVYSLGVVLYLLLSGRRPYRLKRGSRAELEEAILAADLVPPSRSAIGPEDAAARSTTVKRLARDLAGDLDGIVLKALAKDRAARFASPSELSADLKRHLADEPVLASPPSAAHRAGKFVRRHALGVAAASAIVVTLAATAAGMTVQARRVAAERDRANKEARTSGAALGFLTDLFKVSDPGESRGNAVTAREILDQGVENIDRGLAGEPAVQAQLLGTMGTVYMNLGLYRSAEPIQERAVEMRRRVHGDDSPEAMGAMMSLAHLYHRQGRLTDAEKVYGSVVETRRRLLGEDHPDTLAALHGLSTVYLSENRLDEAEKNLREVLERQRRALGDDNEFTIASLNSLGAVQMAQRRFPEAERMYREAVERSRRVQGADHPMTLLYMSNLAIAYMRQGRYPESEKLLEETIDGSRRLLGEDHPDTLTAMNNLGVVYDDTGRYPEAVTIYREVLEARRRKLGENHPDTLSSWNNLANAYMSEGHYAEAEAMLTQVLEGDRKLLGDRHPDTLNALYNLACVTSLRGDRAGALAYLERAVASGYSHWDVMERDSDLKPLRGSTEFQSLVARARKNAPHG